MRLRKVSSWFFAVVLLVLGANAMFLVLITRSHDAVVTAQTHRQDALALAIELHQETEQLARLVRAFTATGESRYLLYYYDILDMRQGEKAVPPGFNPASYWDEVIAGRKPHTMPENGVKRSVAELMKAQGFSALELLALKRILDATMAMNAVEQRAFAATQGLYNPDTDKFVSDGPARLDYAGKLVHSAPYNILKADLSAAVSGLVTLIDQRTNTEVAAARDALEHWILLSLVSMAATIIMAILALRAIRRNVLTPILQLGTGAACLAAGDYSVRTGAPQGFDELTAMGRTLDSMAQAIEDDIRRRHAVQRELEAARRQAEDATRAKSIFLANMSHEIRTPMNAVLGMAHLAMKTQLNPRQYDYVNKIHEAARSLLGVLNDILDFSKVEAGKMELDEGRFRLEDIAGHSLSLVRQRAQEKDVELLLDVANPRLLGDSGAFMGDALRLGQVITNLLSNAVKFTHHGYVRLSVQVEAEDAAGVTLHFSVRDTGIGMSDAQIGRLFQEFTQADGSTTRKYGGTGLGLTISKRIVELMGGRIWVESAPTKGSTFHFTARFPSAKPPALPSVPLPHAASIRVLVVDDQCDARLALINLLSALGVGVAVPGGIDEADDGDTALVMVGLAEQRGQPYGLLLIDWAMPRLDGAGVLKALGPQACGPGLWPVVVSAHDSEVVHGAARAFGARHFLHKPVLPEQLRTLLREMAGHEADVPGSDAAPPLAVDLLGFRVLLVEDNPINQQLAVELMESRGAQVDVAANGEECLSWLHRHPANHYGVVLMDLQMPVMDGYEAARLLRCDQRYVDLPIIAMTAHAMAEERQRCRLLGMNGHISKPIDPALLYASLAELRASRTVAGHVPLSDGMTGSDRQADPDLAGLPEMVGLDVRTGVRHANGKPTLYAEILRRFALDHANFRSDLEVLLVNHRWDDAFRQVHTARGLCASVGAGEVHAQLLDLERILRGRDKSRAHDGLAMATTAVAHLVDGLREHFASVDASGVTDEPDLHPANASMDWLPGLRRLLQEGDNEARDVWRSHRQEIAAQLPEHLIRRVSQALANYDFDTALQLLPDGQQPLR